MPTRAAVHQTQAQDARAAGTEAATKAVEALGAQPDVAFLFATARYEQQTLVNAVRAVVGPACALVGCSAEGVIAHGDSREVDFAASVMAVQLGQGRAEALLAEGFDERPEACADALADAVGDASDLVGLLVFPDGLVGDSTRFLARLHERLPSATIAGGTAADAMTFDRTWQYCNGTVASRAVSALALRGEGRLAIAVSHGCSPIGPHQTLTGVDGAWVKEIDGRPAWDVFKEYLDGDPEDLNADGIVHLCIGTSGEPGGRVASETMIIRTPLALDKATGALMFPGGGFRDGQRIRLTRRDAAQIRETAIACARRVAADAPPAFVLQFDCAGRGKILFGNCAAEEIVQPLRRQLGESVPWTGFHTYGEIAPTVRGLHYHNYTVALCAFYDA